MTFNLFSNIKKSFLFGLTLSFCIHASVNKASAETSRGLKLMELLNQPFDIDICSKEGTTRWDDSLAQDERLYSDDIQKCKNQDFSVSEDSCLLSENSRWEGNITYQLIEIVNNLVEFEEQSLDQDGSPEILEFYKNKIKIAVFNFLVTRDAFKNTQVFDAIFDHGLAMLRSKKMPNSNNAATNNFISVWKSQYPVQKRTVENDNELMNTLSEFKNIILQIPYGGNVCNTGKESSYSNPQSKSLCFLQDNTFLSSVRENRKKEHNCWDRHSKSACKPFEHGLKKQSTEPCGTVVGVWQANQRGNVLKNSLIITSPISGESSSFDSNILSKIIKKIDDDLNQNKNLSR